MFFGLIAVWLLAAPACCLGQDGPGAPGGFGQSYHHGQFPALLQGGFQYWDNGYLIAWAVNRSSIALYDRYGRVARQAVVWFDGADLITVDGVAVSPSGRLVASGGVSNPQGAVATYIAEIGDDDRVRRVIRTFPFSPYDVCAMEDGTVRSYGIDRDEHLNGI